MGDEIVKPLVIEKVPVKQEEKGYKWKIAKMFRSQDQYEEINAIDVANKLIKLESEHKDKIDACTEKIGRLRESQEKLRAAMETLRGMGIPIPEECVLKHRRMTNEGNELKEEIDNEKVFLEYLQSRVLSLIRSVSSSL